MQQVDHLKTQGVPATRACDALEVPRSSYYAWKQPVVKQADPASQPRPQPPRTLSQQERQTVRELLNSDRFSDQSPRQVYATLLDEGSYHCSPSTMYRILHDHDEAGERRNQRQRTQAAKPQLSATQPNQLWSWDITKLLTPVKYTYFYLYVIIDVYSRYVVGWMVAEAELSELAKPLIKTSYRRQQVQPNELTLHADRGAPMVALTTAQLLAQLSVHKTHSRPYTPNDNPYSEAQFKTMKYRPDFPQKFATIAEARAWCGTFFDWYNHHHYHINLELLTPAMVHHGQVGAVVAKRNVVLQTAYEKHPERFVRGVSSQRALPESVWINKPEETATIASLLQ